MFCGSNNIYMTIGSDEALNLLLVSFIHLLLTLTIYGIKPVISLYASSLGITASEISIIVASYALFSAILAVKIGQRIDQFGLRKMLFFGNIVLLLAVGIGSLYPGFLLLIVMQTLLGIGYTWMVIALQKSLVN